MSPQFYGALLFGAILTIAGFVSLYFENKEKREYQELLKQLAKIADSWRLKDEVDPETGRIVKFLLYKRKPDMSLEDTHEIEKDLCELPGLKGYVLAEDI